MLFRVRDTGIIDWRWEASSCKLMVGSCPPSELHWRHHNVLLFGWSLRKEQLAPLRLPPSPSCCTHSPDLPDRKSLQKLLRCSLGQIQSTCQVPAYPESILKYNKVRSWYIYLLYSAGWPHYKSNLGKPRLWLEILNPEIIYISGLSHFLWKLKTLSKFKQMQNNTKPVQEGLGEAGAR